MVTNERFLHAYLENTVEMRAMLTQRTLDEVVYDNDVLASTKKQAERTRPDSGKVGPRRRFVSG